MKRIITGVMVCFFILTQAAYAHPPSNIETTFNGLDNTLNVAVIHPVDNPKSHFIERITVSLNGKKIIEQKFSEQENSNSQYASFYIPGVKNGDTISVEAYCSINGQLIKQLKIK